MREFIKWINFIPLFWLIIFILFCLRAAGKLGKLPTAYHPDPKNLNFDIHHNMIWILGCLLILFIIPFILSVDIFSLAKGKTSLIKIFKSRIYVWLFVAFLWLNPLGLVNWFLD